MQFTDCLNAGILKALYKVNHIVCVRVCAYGQVSVLVRMSPPPKQ